MSEGKDQAKHCDFVDAEQRSDIDGDAEWL